MEPYLYYLLRASIVTVLFYGCSLPDRVQSDYRHHPKIRKTNACPSYCFVCN